MSRKTGRKAMREGKTKGSKQLYQWVEDRDLTYEVAGQLLGFTKGRLSRYINGRNKPDPDSMYRIFKLTGIEMSSWIEN